MVYDRVAALAGSILQKDEADFSTAFVLDKENGVEAIDIAKLAIACEKEFRLALYDEKIARWNTLGDICAHIERLLEAGEAEAVKRSDKDRAGWYY